MNKEYKYTLYIGLKTYDMKTNLNEVETLNLITEKLIKYNIIGFNVEKIKGFYNAIKENSLKISFINTYGIDFKTIVKIIKELRKELKQECILLEQEKVKYNFI